MYKQLNKKKSAQKVLSKQKAARAKKGKESSTKIEKMYIDSDDDLEEIYSTGSNHRSTSNSSYASIPPTFRNAQELSNISRAYRSNAQGTFNTSRARRSYAQGPSYTSRAHRSNAQEPSYTSRANRSNAQEPSNTSRTRAHRSNAQEPLNTSRAHRSSEPDSTDSLFSPTTGTTTAEVHEIPNKKAAKHRRSRRKHGRAKRIMPSLAELNKISADSDDDLEKISSTNPTSQSHQHRTSRHKNIPSSFRRPQEPEPSNSSDVVKRSEPDDTDVFFSPTTGTTRAEVHEIPTKLSQNTSKQPIMNTLNTSLVRRSKRINTYNDTVTLSPSDPSMNICSPSDVNEIDSAPAAPPQISSDSTPEVSAPIFKVPQVPVARTSRGHRSERPSSTGIPKVERNERHYRRSHELMMTRRIHRCSHGGIVCHGTVDDSVVGSGGGSVVSRVGRSVVGSVVGRAPRRRRRRIVSASMIMPTFDDLEQMYRYTPADQETLGYYCGLSVSNHENIPPKNLPGHNNPPQPINTELPLPPSPPPSMPLLDLPLSPSPPTSMPLQETPIASEGTTSTEPATIPSFSSPSTSRQSPPREREKIQPCEIN